MTTRAHSRKCSSWGGHSYEDDIIMLGLGLIITTHQSITYNSSSSGMHPTTAIPLIFWRALHRIKLCIGLQLLFNCLSATMFLYQDENDRQLLDLFSIFVTIFVMVSTTIRYATLSCILAYKYLLQGIFCLLCSLRLEYDWGPFWLIDTKLLLQVASRPSRRAKKKAAHSFCYYEHQRNKKGFSKDSSY